ncbi:MAG: hypothetical protein N4A38_01640 [Candidatus Gracilibacteria bacterium]|jgi:hypothetical protein|nr:hypothetical protein [Candidatus Gracilibacteria bacterium]
MIKKIVLIFTILCVFFCENAVAEVFYGQNATQKIEEVKSTFTFLNQNSTNFFQAKGYKPVQLKTKDFNIYLRDDETQLVAYSDTGDITCLVYDLYNKEVLFFFQNWEDQKDEFHPFQEERLLLSDKGEGIVRVLTMLKKESALYHLFN